MDRLVSVHSDGWAYGPTRREWDWLWAKIAFCPDVLSRIPYDMSGWCLPDFTAVSVRPLDVRQPSTEPSTYGPAMFFPNANGPIYSTGWKWTDTLVENQFGLGGSDTVWLEWTLAFSLEHRSEASGGLFVTRITVNIGAGATMTAFFKTADRGLIWRINPGDVVSSGHVTDEIRAAHNYVITTTWSGTVKNTRIYEDGILSADANISFPLFKPLGIAIGGANLVKEGDCIGGPVGPYIITRGAWSESEVQMWSADPWGFMRTDAHPTPPPPFILPLPRFTCAVQGRDVPAEAEDRDVPAETADRDLPAEAAARDLPAEAAARDLPAEADARDLPAEADARDLPAETAARDLPAEADSRTVPGPDDSGDRETDVEDHAAPRTTGVGGQSC